MNYRKIILCAVIMIHSTPLVSNNNCTDQIELLDNDIEDTINKLSDDYSEKYTQDLSRPHKIDGFTDRIKIRCRMIGIALLSCAADAQEWFSQTKYKVRSWFVNA